MEDSERRAKATLELIQKTFNGEKLRAPKLNVNDARAEYRMQYEFKRQHSRLTDINSNITQNSSPVYASEAPFCSLSRIGIKDLEVHIPAKGSYLLLRTIELPIMVVGIMLFVEDHLGRVIIVTLYNYVDYNFSVSAEELLPVGTVFVIKEPYLKLAASGQIVIRCDCPTDVILIDQLHPMYENICKIKWKNIIDPIYLHKSYPSTAIEWKEKGNMLYNQRNFSTCLQAYFSALKMTTDAQLTVILQLNICAAYLEFSYFENCIKYARLVLNSQSDNVKAMYRAGRSHYSLGQFSEALSLFQHVLKIDLSHKNSLMEEKRCCERLKEKEGIFDMYKMYLTSLVKPNAPIDFGEYIGPFEVTLIEGKGRGVVATQNIKPGTFLLVSKAFQTVFEAPFTNGVAVSINCDFTMDHGNKVKLLAQTCQAVMKNPNTFGNKIYSLSTNDPEMDKNFKVFCDSNKEPIADACRIRKILNINCFSLLPVKHHDSSSAKEQIKGSGLFINASYFNHSCISNANWKTYNDIIVIRSKKFIKKGDEITITYSSSREDFLKKEERFLQQGFVCKCILCRLDRSEPRRIHQKRAKLEAAHQALTDEYHTDVLMPKIQNQMNKVKRELEMTYAQRSTLNIKLFDCYMRVARGIVMSHNKDTSSRLAEVVDKALGALGLSCELLLKCSKNEDFYLPEDALLCQESVELALVLLVYHFQMTDNFQLAQKWAKVLVRFHHLFTGGSVPMLKSLLKDSYPNLYVTLLSAIE